MSWCRRIAGWVPFLLAAGAVTTTPARAHVAPAVNANNRYLRITPMRDRIRLAYTVYIGERPGAEARVRMDRDGDGALSQAEGEAYADELASAVAPALEVTIDGVPHTVTWAERHVGLGVPTTRAGSFSIDLIAWLCAADLAEHRAVIHDRYRVPLPGETEVKVQQSPGITIGRASLGDEQRGSRLDMKWSGNDGPMARLGLYLEYSVDGARATAPPGDHCRPGRAAAGSEKAGPKRNWPALIALLVAALAGLFWFVWQRARNPSS